MNGLIGLLCLIWGFNWVFMKLANGVFPPVLFAGYRFALGALVLIAVCMVRRVPLPRMRDLKWYILCGILQTMYFNLAIQLSLEDLSAGLTSVLTYSMPLWLTLMAHFLLPGEQLRIRKLLGVVIGIIGLFVAMDAHWSGSTPALLLAVSSGLSWALANLLVKRKLGHCDMLQFTTWQMIVGAAGLLLYSVIFEHGESHWGVMPVVYVLFSGIVGSALAFVMWSYILSKVEASKASISLLLVPVIGVVSGVLFLNESLSMVTIAGIVFVLMGIWLVNGKSRRQETGVQAAAGQEQQTQVMK
ncbi:EamA family transporter [Paenibacillus sp. HJL G12]|uniref:EamA family transporter n=1 Tax=Paenibacillus dendrobii TaxID=2691084 RepID=A0A7X3ILX4_9BACL|nr:DMT family transporter [Paenibacillus dendrobii]MWV46359.1 EamA family transporter [Paenibacillus dendrobii]